MANRIRRPLAKGSSADVTLPATLDPNAYRQERCLLSFRCVHNRRGYRLNDHQRRAVKRFVACLKKACEQTWEQLYATGGKSYGSKTGLGYTPYGNRVPAEYKSAPDHLPEEADVGSLRASDVLRVVGGKVGSVFYVLWFVRSH